MARPCPGGFSIGHTAITAGTFGCVVEFTYAGRTTLGILSNWHVLCGKSGESGDLIVQPGVYDILGGEVTDEQLER